MQCIQRDGKFSVAELGAPPRPKLKCSAALKAQCLPLCLLFDAAYSSVSKLSGTRGVIEL
jgi:hypothetical protein